LASGPKKDVLGADLLCRLWIKTVILPTVMAVSQVQPKHASHRNVESGLLSCESIETGSKLFGEGVFFQTDHAQAGRAVCPPQQCLTAIISDPATDKPEFPK
jgi:hypothetical protein